MKIQYTLTEGEVENNVNFPKDRIAGWKEVSDSLGEKYGDESLIATVD